MKSDSSDERARGEGSQPDLGRETVTRRICGPATVAAVCAVTKPSLEPRTLENLDYRIVHHRCLDAAVKIWAEWKLTPNLQLSGRCRSPYHHKQTKKVPIANSRRAGMPTRLRENHIVSDRKKYQSTIIFADFTRQARAKRVTLTNRPCARAAGPTSATLSQRPRCGRV
ncbi:hypothetical protein EVAR_30430_1 [Eumeta japonica]|uniref:Uncharacterized protein n=1 Tax=Eumeta variegata TaxID=151549 RepID=A0A4C1W6Y6_EUMVA|nr:hypothetical protein EVAR_30430_1 [Eumeta japonica]